MDIDSYYILVLVVILGLGLWGYYDVTHSAKKNNFVFG